MPSFKIIISSKAQSDLAERVSFTSNVSKEAASELAKELFDSIKSLSSFPERNPVFEMPKSFPFTVRKFIVKKTYIILYAIESDKVVIYRILDSRRKLSRLIYQ